jgi:hydroxymethylglutaryl-CoA synthase
MVARMSSSRPVGIDAIAVHVPRLYVDLCGEWASVRAPVLGEASVEALVGKIRRGVGVEQMSIPDAHEDSATLAAMAAARVIEQAGIDPRDIGAIAVGTETTVDQSKSIAAYVLGMLERRFGVDLREVGAPQFQFACIGATYALESVVNAFRAGEATKRYSLVIATDVSRYPLATSGEYTQGAGAVAMLVSEDPRLLVLDPRVQSTITRDERDFFRPNGLSTATVDGKYSIDVYLDCIGDAARLFRRRLTDLHGVDEPLDRALGRLVFHIPFPRMAEYAALRVLGETWHPEIASTDRRAFERELAKTERFKEFFASRIASSLELSRRIGNIYSGSMYLGLVSLLENTDDLDRLRGERVGFFSYGSGASARVFSGVFVDPQSHVRHARALVEGSSGGRVPLSLEQYEALHRGPHDGSLPLALRQPAPSVIPPEGEFALQRIGTEVGERRTDLGYRYYDWVA